MAELNVDDLIPGTYFQQALLDGEVDELVHADRVADPGDTFSVQGVTIEVIEVEETTVADAVPKDAQEDFDPGDDETVYVLHLERQE